MRVLKGWTEHQQEELEWQKESGNELDDVIDTLYNMHVDCYLYDKYQRDDDPQQVLLDIVDYWRGDAKFPVTKYIVHDKFTQMYVANQTGENTYYWSKTNWGTAKSRKEWLDINKNYQPFLEEVVDSENI
ncbi:hypothetical protein [Companilactobacillus sp.]|uniref:hypothetical protein n=1 Tax=Companilactobacillus sp. TaxID=2767905 RepID=UPI00260BECFD|nr:hypothetical protein [Companilactobacillus sp.]